jgi:peroxiredoxin
MRARAPSSDARLVAISPQSPDQSLSTAEKAGLDFTVLSDPASRVAEEIGIVFQQADEVLGAQRKLGLDLAQVNAEGSTRLPRPTVLIVDQDRTVRFVDVQPDYTARTDVYLARRGRGAAALSTALNSNAINVTAGLLVPATIIDLGKPSASGLLVAGWPTCPRATSRPTPPGSPAPRSATT